MLFDRMVIFYVRFFEQSVVQKDLSSGKVTKAAEKAQKKK